MAPIESTTSDRPNHQRSKSSVLKSFVQRRQPSRGDPLPSPATTEESSAQHSLLSGEDPAAMVQFHRNNPGALGELQHNQQEPAPRSPRKAAQDEIGENARGRSRSPTKAALGLISMRPPESKGAATKASKSRDPSPTKPKKQKSSTNLVGLLSKPKSLRNLYKLATEDEIRATKDKENRTPDESMSSAGPPPIFAQFTSDPMTRQQRDASIHLTGNAGGDADSTAATRPMIKERPQSYQVPTNTHGDLSAASSHSASRSPSKTRTDGSQAASKGRRVPGFRALPGFGHSRSKSATACGTGGAAEEALDPKEIDKHLEAMLDRRNIPENQRYKMRSLSNTIKMEFIRQDWAEMQAARADRSYTADSFNSADGSAAITPGSDGEEERGRKTKERSFTFSRGKKDSTSPAKKQRGEGTLGRHFRSKSAESVVSERPTSSGSSSTPNLFAKLKASQGPADYVAYLRKVQRPQLVEVGKLHKLRLLLRNETVAWIEEFIQQGGMKEIVGLLKRIMEVEWREEHEDALLHENLLCLKALSTTARAMQYLHSIEADLYPKLLLMLFDPERKGPSEFTTRNIITSVLFTYIESAAPAERVTRARSVLQHLRDPKPKDDEQPLPFVMEMRQDRPFRVWCKEVVSVTKEVFWIFLHNLNVIALPSDKDQNGTAADPEGDDAFSYMLHHFPQERPPVPAAPYVGGVEWDATNYLASHLDLLNAILACTPSAAERNALRAQLRISGWERCLGGSMRLCKEKFYGSVHDGLRRWIAAAARDGWPVGDVRYGPPPEARSSPRKTGGGGGGGGGGGKRKKTVEEEAPRIDMPKLDFELDRQPARKDIDAWL